MAYTPVEAIGYKAWIKEYTRVYDAKVYDIANNTPVLGSGGNQFREGSIFVFDPSSKIWKRTLGNVDSYYSPEVTGAIHIGFVYPGPVAYTSNGVPVVTRTILESGKVKLVLPPAIVSYEKDNPAYFHIPDPGTGNPPELGDAVFLYQDSNGSFVLTKAPTNPGTYLKLGDVIGEEGNFLEVSFYANPQIVTI